MQLRVRRLSIHGAIGIASGGRIAIAAARLPPTAIAGRVLGVRQNNGRAKQIMDATDRFRKRLALDMAAASGEFRLPPGENYIGPAK
jgi:hypothetical protein